MNSIVYIDPVGHLWSPDRDTLHAFAKRIGLKREWFQDRPVLYHYDVMSPRLRHQAIIRGAVKVTSRQLVVMMRIEK